MRLKNNTNDKIIEIAKADFDRFTPKAKSKFTVLTDSDVTSTDQILENKAAKSVIVKDAVPKKDTKPSTVKPKAK